MPIIFANGTGLASLLLQSFQSLSSSIAKFCTFTCQNRVCIDVTVNGKQSTILVRIRGVVVTNLPHI